MVVSLVIAGLLPLVACRPVPPPQGVAMAWESFPLAADPRFGQDQASQRLLALTHQGLLRRDARLDLVPDGCLAWRWEVPCRRLSFDFPGTGLPAETPWFRFHPGRPLQAEDALASLEALRDPALASPKAGPFREGIARLEVVRRRGLSTLVIHLRKDDPGFAANLARGGLGLCPREGPSTEGSGPYRLRSFEPGRIRLEARREGPDIREDLDLRLMPDANTRLLALRHGSVQASLNNLPADLLGGGQGFEVRRSPGANLEYLAFRCDHPILGDPRVRRALSLALDRRALVAGLMGGMAREAWGFFPPDMAWGADPLRRDPPEGDLREARRLLDEAGHLPDARGRRFALTLSCTPQVEARMKALAIQAQWRRAGVDLRILSREFGTLFTEVVAGRFEVAALRWTGAVDPDMLRQVFHSGSVPPAGFNRGRFADAEVDRMLDASRSLQGEARNRLLRDLQDRLRLLSPYAFLWWPDQVAALAPGLSLDLNGAGDFTGIWRGRLP